MKALLIFAPQSPHSEKFIKMLEGNVNYILIAGKTDLNMNLSQKYVTIEQRSLKGILMIIKNLWFTYHDYVHVHSLNFTALIVALFAVRPIIVTGWGSDILLVPNRSKMHRLTTQFILWRAHKISVNSSLNMKQAIDIILGNNKIIYPIHFGISKETKKISFSKKENIIYSPRGHADLYNINKIIEAFRIFHLKNPDWKLIISGAEHPINTPKLKKQAQGLPVIFTGWLNPQQHSDWNAKAKIVVSIPSSDALSVTIMEAIYSNCICFASDLLPNREVIIEGENGFIDNLHFEKWKKINPIVMQKINKAISKDWTFEYNQKRFLDLYSENISTHKELILWIIFANLFLGLLGSIIYGTGYIAYYLGKLILGQ